LNLTQIWQSALGDLQMQTVRTDYETWLKRTALVSVDGGLAVVGTPNIFVKETLENRFIGPIRRTLGNILGYPVQVRVVLHSPGSTFGTAQTVERVEQPVAVGSNGNGTSHGHSNGNGHTALIDEDSVEDFVPAAPRPAPAAGVPQQLELPSTRSSVLNSRYTFSSFIVGGSNRLAHAACLAVAEHPAQAYNPLFLYGGVGLGKTHLLHAIGNYALDRNPEINVLYVSSEKFTNDLINAIRRQQTEEFRIRYRNIDILLIDDIQFIAGKEGTQEEFFHTFNTLHGAGKQIVISSDRPPKAILTLEERLRSRFEWGLIVDVQTPDLETRTAILRTKGDQLQVHVPPEVIDFLAHKIQSNIRELEGCLNRVVAYASLNQVPVNIEVASSALSDLLDTSRRKRVSPDDIIREVATHYGVDARAIKGRARSRNIVVPRQVTMYLMREETESSLMEIGNLLGGRDHTTVMHGYEKITEEITVDSRLRNDILSIRQRLYGEGRES
jgi:chromosomal replication initiator protein